MTEHRQDPPEEHAKKKTLKKKNKSGDQHLQHDKKRKLECDNLEEPVKVKKKKKGVIGNAEDKVKKSVLPGVCITFSQKAKIYINVTSRLS